MANRKEKTKPGEVVSPPAAERPLPSCIGLDAQGGKLPPIPMSEALRDALFADARRCIRSPRDQVLAILDAYYQLDAPPGKLTHIRRIGQQLTAIIEHPDTPQVIFELLTDLWFELRNQSDRPVTPERIAAEMREGWPALADVLGEES